MGKPTICVDFDGVIHSYMSGWHGPGKALDPPVDGALDWLRRLYEQDELGEISLNVAIYSSRSSSLRGRWAMKRWLKDWLYHEYGMAGGPHLDPLYLEIPQWLKWPWVKPSALITLDDRAICFDGRFPSTEEVFGFKPWNRKQQQQQG